VANFVYNRAATRIGSDALQLSTSTLKVILVTASYVANRDHDFVDMGGANDPIDHELNGVTNYTRGFGGAGRKTVANKVFTEDDANDRGELDVDDVVWTALGAGGQGDVAAAILIKENTNDADSELISYYDSGFPKTLNGGDLTVQVNAEGLLQFSTV
jgi:hypothetical protein